jgi:hypothetical protein
MSICPDPTRPARRLRERGRTPLFGLAGGGAALLLTALFLSSLAPGPAPASSSLTTSAAIPPWNSWTCNPNNPSPAALDIPLANPAQFKGAGSVLTVAYEFKVLGYVRADLGVGLDFPTAKAVLPTALTGELTVTIPAKNVSVAGKGWSSPTLLNGSTKLAAKTTFAATDAYLTTAKYAVLADAASGTLTLEIRWHWSFELPKGGAPDVGPWSVPSNTSSGTYLPSIFFPAPFVGVLATSASPAPAGSNFTLELNGSVANTSFRLVLEYPNNGTEIQSIWENTTVGASEFNATVPLSLRNGSPVPAGKYLVHVHDVCEAIVRMISVTVTAGMVGGPAGPVGRVDLARS